jgi:hypothetical protein
MNAFVFDVLGLEAGNKQTAVHKLEAVVNMLIIWKSSQSR